MLLTAPRRGAKPLAGVRVGVPTASFGGVAVDAGIAARTEAAARELAELGATLVSFVAAASGADNLSGAGFSFFLTVPGREIDAYHRRWFPKRAADYTSDVAFTLTLLRAANVLPPDPDAGRATIAALRRGWEDAFSANRVDLVLQPAAVVPAPKRGDAMFATQSIGDPMVVWDYLGWPVVCIPAGKGSDGLPVGIQLAGRPGSERLLCDVAITAQAHNPHHEQRPPGI
jgi:aspartyl-tRNA(Asn)/glutamyl-tRNA(Gln) amidotransferase subunit A